MTDLDLDRLEALADAATPGPWEVNSQTAWSEVGDYTVYGIKDVDDATMTYDDAPAFAHTMGMEQADAVFIAETSPDVIKELIQQLREARAGLAKVAAISSKLRGDGHHGIADKLDKACDE